MPEAGMQDWIAAALSDEQKVVFASTSSHSSILAAAVCQGSPRWRIECAASSSVANAGGVAGGLIVVLIEAIRWRPMESLVCR